jgi:hypothetical protein
MGKPAREIQNRILQELPPNKRLFPINSGMGWVGKIVKRTPGMIILENPRPLHGAPPGWTDLCGWETITVTEDMIGQEIAVDMCLGMGVRWRMVTD